MHLKVCEQLQTLWGSSEHHFSHGRVSVDSCKPRNQPMKAPTTALGLMQEHQQPGPDHQQPTHTLLQTAAKEQLCSSWGILQLPAGSKRLLLSWQIFQ